MFSYPPGRRPQRLSPTAICQLRTSSGELLSTLPLDANTYEGMDAGWPCIVTEISLPEARRLILDTCKPDHSRLLRTTACVQRHKDGEWVHVKGQDFFRSLVCYRVRSHAPRWVQEQHADQLCKLDDLRSDIARHYGEVAWLDPATPSDRAQALEGGSTRCES